MDIKKKIEEIARKLLSDKDLLEKFEKNPAKVIEDYLDVELPDDQVNALIKGIQAKITAEKVGDTLGALGGLFGRK